MGLAHVVGGEYPSFLHKGGDHLGGDLEIDHVHVSLSRQPQLGAGDAHGDGEPLAVARMAEDGSDEVLLKGVVGGDAVGVGDVGKYSRNRWQLRD